ncbi:hypothetical protein NPIL_559231 [Nephila pilipes]|uniref:Uncharacterized protein n=1 Tax=Nephila pilipes TaxID=299642 RepID=A0A8X6UPU5_NEPPI|nr:hypothetical protein NPIL_278331 [Nephila pilipes]GFU31231.1 hypothetical protein NPIL_559231 [Nephila pilipes]
MMTYLSSHWLVGVPNLLAEFWKKKNSLVKGVGKLDMRHTQAITLPGGVRRHRSTFTVMRLDLMLITVLSCLLCSSVEVESTLTPYDSNHSQLESDP